MNTATKILLHRYGRCQTTSDIIETIENKIGNDDQDQIVDWLASELLMVVEDVRRTESITPIYDESGVTSGAGIKNDDDFQPAT